MGAIFFMRQNKSYVYRRVLTGWCYLIGIGLVLAMLASCGGDPSAIRVGILHSFTGDMAVSERAVADATLMALEEINAAGGVLGRKIEPVLVDSQSDDATAAREAERLIAQEKVSAIFGCWKSSCRKAVKPVVERHQHLLFYPVQYEGVEQSESIVYLGATPNQQIIPAVAWSQQHLGKRFYLVGSDYVFPHVANEIIKTMAEAIGFEIVGEDYIPSGSQDVSALVSRIKVARPDVVMNTINGSSNLAFFRELRHAGVSARQTPVMSFSLAENELSALPGEVVAGDYAAWNYFQSLDTPQNREFIAKFKQRFGKERVVSDAMVKAYVGVMLWKQAVSEAGSADPVLVGKAISHQSLYGVLERVAVDPHNRHLWQKTYIGQIQHDRQFKVVYRPEGLIRPRPYPMMRSQHEWENGLQLWGGRR